MDSTKTEEGWLDTPDAQRLYTKTWCPKVPLRARLVFLHGFSDHCNFYGVLFPTLVEQGVKVYSFDQRGWGRSVHEPSQRGLTGPTSQVMQDITTFIRSLPQNEKDIPLFLMGHSMGGAEMLVYAASGPKDVVSTIRGFLVEAPFIALHPSSQPWKATLVLGRLAGKLLPHRQMVQKLDPSTMSRDQDVCIAWRNDELNHDTGTLEGLAGMLDRASDLNDGRIVLKDGLGENSKTRVWVGHGTADGACSYAATRKFYDRLKIEDKEMRVYEGWYHKLHMELGDDKHIFSNDVSKWILDRSGSNASGEPAPSTKPKL